VVDLRALRTGDAIAFVQRQTQCLQPPALKCVVNAMRSFLRYVQYRGEVATALAAAVPIVAAWAATPALPRRYHPSMLSVQSIGEPEDRSRLKPFIT
jgi:integrase/recombinase XerD